jgi:hypothetical protein
MDGLTAVAPVAMRASKHMDTAADVRCSIANINQILWTSLLNFTYTEWRWFTAMDYLFNVFYMSNHTRCATRGRLSTTGCTYALITYIYMIYQVSIYLQKVHRTYGNNSKIDPAAGFDMAVRVVLGWPCSPYSTVGFIFSHLNYDACQHELWLRPPAFLSSAHDTSMTSVVLTNSASLTMTNQSFDITIHAILPSGLHLIHQR